MTDSARPATWSLEDRCLAFVARLSGADSPAGAKFFPPEFTLELTAAGVCDEWVLSIAVLAFAAEIAHALWMGREDNALLSDAVPEPVRDYVWPPFDCAA